MPNHLHMLVGLNLRFAEMSAVSLMTVMRTLKSRTTYRYTNGVRMGLLPPFGQHLWQPGYYDTIMRNEAMTEERRRYIVNNPANWRDDPYHESADTNLNRR